MRLTQAQTARIQALENAKGQVTPKRVLDDARKVSSPLHALFDWTMKSAAEKWWLHQARLIIGAVRVQITTSETVYRAPCYVVDTTIAGSGYRSIATITDDPESARESLIYTLDVAAGHIRRAYDLAGPLGLQGEIDALLKQVAGVQRIVGKKAA